MSKHFLVALGLAALPLAPAAAQADQRQVRGERVVAELTGGAGQPALARLREEFPFLADATTEFALGEVWGRRELDPRTRQLATVAAFAATGNLAQMKVHAGYALNLGVRADELKEIIYLTIVHAGFPRALDAAGALGDALAERRNRTPAGE